MFPVQMNPYASMNTVSFNTYMPMQAYNTLAMNAMPSVDINIYGNDQVSFSPQAQAYMGGGFNGMQEAQMMMAMGMMMMMMVQAMGNQGTMNQFGQQAAGVPNGLGNQVGNTAANGANAAPGANNAATANNANTVAGNNAPTATGNKLADVAGAMAGQNFKAGQTLRCADFVSTMIEKAGVAPPGFQHQVSCNELQKYGAKVGKDQLQPGDVVFFGNTYQAGQYTHVGIYLGNGKFVHRPTADQPVKIDDLNSNYYGSKFTGGRRLNA